MPEVLRWGAAAAEAFGTHRRTGTWARSVARRLPAGLRSVIEHGVLDGLVVVDGHQFTLPGLRARAPTPGSVAAPRLPYLLQDGADSVLARQPFRLALSGLTA